MPPLKAIRPSARDVFWFAIGAAILLIGAILLAVFRGDRASVRKVAAKAKRVDAANGIRVALSAAANAETSAVLALTDLDSEAYAQQARAAIAEVERERATLADLLKADGTPTERSLMDRFTEDFARFRRISTDLLALSVRNSNLKAFALAFGPADETLEQTDSALSRLAAKSSERPQVTRLALEAQNAALRIQVLLAPHIAEESEKKMDELEAAMAKQDEIVRTDLARLKAVRDLHGDPDLEAAESSYARYGALRTQMLALSRENTNVRSTALSLKDNRETLRACQNALDALERAIRAEQPVQVDYGRFGRPAELP